MRALRSYLFPVLLCLPASLVYAWQKPHAPGTPPAVVKATADRQKILIGEPIHLMLEATVPDNVPFSWPALDSLPHFEWVEKHDVDTTVRPGEKYYRQYLTVTSFDSGSWAIPRLPFLSGKKAVLTDSIRISVDYTK